MSPTRRVRLSCDEAWPVLCVENSPENGGFDGWPVPENLVKERESLMRRLHQIEKEIVQEALSQGMPADRVDAIRETWLDLP